MCSIAGAFTKTEVGKMLDIMSHRSPDGKSIVTKGGFVLGAGSLIITDTKSPHKCPYVYKNLTLVFNGEIYNFEKIRNILVSKGYTFDTNSDTEVVIKAFDEWGVDSFEMFDGMFAIGILNTKTHLLYLARDPFGEKPLYYRNSYNAVENTFAFASEAKALIEDSKLKPKAPPLYELLQFCNNETLYQDISQLPQGSYMIIDTKTEVVIEERVYYDILDNLIVHTSHGLEHYIENLDYLMQKVVHQRIPKEVPFALYLSKGVDSNLLNYYIKNITKDFETLTFEDMSKEEYDEVIEKVVYHLDFPVGSLSSVALYKLGERAKTKGCKVVISGEGADESFGGYMRYLPIAYKYQLEQFYPSYRELFEKGDVFITENETMYSNLVNKFEVGRGQLRFLESKYKKYASLTDPITAMQIFDIKHVLPSLLQMGDRMASAHGLENRSPYLAKELVEFGLSLPYEYKINGITTKVLLRELARRKGVKITETEKKGLTIPFNKWNGVSGYSRDKYFQELNNIWRKQAKRHEYGTI